MNYFVVHTHSRLDMRCDSWQPLSSLDCRRQCCAAVATDDCIYAAGGYTGESVHRSVEFLDLRRAQWESCAAMSSRRRNFGLALIAGSVVACGGQEELWSVQNVFIQSKKLTSF